MVADSGAAASPECTVARSIGCTALVTSIGARLPGETSEEMSLVGMSEETSSAEMCEGIGSLAAAIMVESIMATFGVIGAADGGHMVLAHAGGLHLTATMFGSASDLALP